MQSFFEKKHKFSQIREVRIVSVMDHLGNPRKYSKFPLFFTRLSYNFLYRDIVAIDGMTNISKS